MARNNQYQDMDRYRKSTFERRDYEGDYGESSRNHGWDQNFNNWRQNDFGTRRHIQDNFRDTRWGSTTGPHFGKGPKGWRRTDERIQEEACEALYLNPRIDASDIEVKVEEGVLTMRGQVDSRDTKRAAERCVEDISGISDVHNQLRIKTSGTEQINSSLS